MGALTLVSAAAILAVVAGCGGGQSESLGLGQFEPVPDWQRATNLSRYGVAGAKIFARASCLNCHTYRGVGTTNLGGSDLTNVGDENHGVRWLIRYVSCPPCVSENTVMPRFKDLGKENLRLLAVFLHESGDRH